MFGLLISTRVRGEPEIPVMTEHFRPDDILIFKAGICNLFSKAAPVAG
jgi:hypothetical protein